MPKDLYGELGVARSAAPEDIRKAYRRLVKELHPDARPDDKQAEERFKRVTAAFDLLSDPVKRKRYDRGEIDAEGNERHRAHAGAGARGHGPFHGGFSSGGGGFEDLSDVLNGMFGDSGGPFRSRGEDVRYKLSVGFVEAAVGGRKRVVMGDGRALDLVIPEGARAGQVLRLRGQGRGGQGRPVGDALVEIEVEAHPYFERKGDDVHLELPVTLKEAVLGAKVRAPTLTGPVTLTVPKGSNSGSVLRLRGKGIKGEKGFGDQLVRLVVMLPERPDNELQRFASDWTPAREYDPRKKFGL